MKLINESLITDLEEICPNGVYKNASLSEVSSWQVGGKASVLVTPSNVEQIKRLIKLICLYDIPFLIIGNSTNLLFTDEGVEAVVIQVGSCFSDISIECNQITAQTGLWVPKLARKAMQAGLTGLEHICGIPGTLGGLVVMNGGSQRKNIGDNITHVKTIDKEGKIKLYNQEDCGFGYRSSIFQGKDEVVIEAGLKLKSAKSKKSIHSEMFKILKDRSNKFPRKQANCGSVFVSDPDMYPKFGPPGRIIEECGLKGMSFGRAQVSPAHANFIVNNGNASAKEILFLISHVRYKVFECTGFLMKVEPKFVTEKGIIIDI